MSIIVNAWRCITDHLEELIRLAFYQDAFGGCIGMYYVVSDTKFEILAPPIYVHWHLGMMFPGVCLCIYEGHPLSSWLHKIRQICFYLLKF